MFQCPFETTKNSSDFFNLSIRTFRTFKVFRYLKLIARSIFLINVSHDANAREIFSEKLSFDGLEE